MRTRNVRHQHRAARIVFGLLLAPTFGLFAAIAGRAVVQGATTSILGASGAALLFAVIAVYGVDQVLTGAWPLRSRWVDRFDAWLDRAGLSPGFGERLSLPVGALFGVRIRLHVTLPIAALFFSAQGLRAGRIAGLLLLILVHELGHAALMKAFKLRVVGIVLHGAGGECAAAGFAMPVQLAAIAWGGVLAQGALWLVAWRVGGVPSATLEGDLSWAFTVANPFMIALNLLPIPPLDGAAAWRLPGLLLTARPTTPFAREVAKRDQDGDDERPGAEVTDLVARIKRDTKYLN